jgi:hypothetical protein
MSLSTLPRRRIHRAVDERSRAPRVDLRPRRRGDPGTDAAARPGSRFRCGRLGRLLHDDAGMSTVEYAIGCVAAAGFAALLYSVVTGDSVTAALTQLVQRALTAGF